MVTIYHALGADTTQRSSGDPAPDSLELVAVALGTDDLGEAFDLTLHDDGDAWTARREVQVIGLARGKRSSQEGDVFVSNEGRAFVAEANGFRHITELLLPFLR